MQANKTIKALEERISQEQAMWCTHWTHCWWCTHGALIGSTAASAACHKTQMPQGVRSGKSVIIVWLAKSIFICTSSIWCMLMHDVI